MRAPRLGAAAQYGQQAVDWKTVDVATMIRTSRHDTRREEAGTAATTTPATPTVRDYG